jgi:hypothetical protein
MIDYPRIGLSRYRSLAASRGNPIELRPTPANSPSLQTTPARNQARCCVLQLASNLETEPPGKKHAHSCEAKSHKGAANSVNAFLPLSLDCSSGLNELAHPNLPLRASFGTRPVVEAMIL